MAQTWHFSMVSIPTYPNISQPFMVIYRDSFTVTVIGATISEFPVISSRNFWAAQLPMGNAQRVNRGTSGGNVRMAYPGTVPHG